MPGYEDLTPEQLIYIVHMVLIIVSIYSIVQIVKTILTLKISKNVKHLELMIENKIHDGIKKPSLFETIKLWWSERKAKKELESPYKIPKKFK